MTFKFFFIEFEDAREYNLGHILYSCVTAAESWFEDNVVRFTQFYFCV